MKTKNILLFILLGAFMTVKAQTISELEKEIEREKAESVRLEKELYEKKMRKADEALEKAKERIRRHSYDKLYCTKQADELSKQGYEDAAQVLLQWCNQNTDLIVKRNTKSSGNNSTLENNIERQVMSAQMQTQKEKREKEIRSAKRAIGDVDKLLPNANERQRKELEDIQNGLNNQVKMREQQQQQQQRGQNQQKQQQQQRGQNQQKQQQPTLSQQEEAEEDLQDLLNRIAALEREIAKSQSGN